MCIIEYMHARVRVNNFTMFTVVNLIARVGTMSLLEMESTMQINISLDMTKHVFVTHKSTVARTVMCRQDGRGRFPVSLDDHSKCRTNSQRKSQLS